jgi:DnaJ-class molecular chaperone
MDEPFDPSRYKMTFCPLCEGDGKVTKPPEGVEVCNECGGFGLIKQKKDNRIVSRAFLRRT